MVDFGRVCNRAEWGKCLLLSDCQVDRCVERNRAQPAEALEVDQEEVSEAESREDRA